MQTAIHRMKFQQGRFTRWLQQLFCVLLGSLLLYLPAVVVAQDVQPVPALTARVIDQTGTLTEADRQEMEAKLAAYEHSKGSQIVVLMVESTQPEDIASYANRVASTWKIGRRDVGDGVLVIVAKGDRRMRIEVARALEGTLPDLTAARILDVAMKPEFRKGNYAGGISAALDLIMKAIDGEELPLPGKEEEGLSDEDGGWQFSMVAAGIVSYVLARPVKKKLGKLKGTLTNTALVGGVTYLLSSGNAFIYFWAAFVALIVTALRGEGVFSGSSGGGGGSSSSGGWSGGSSSWGGSSGSSSGGGGFSSGGGGSFGGGGASDSW